MNRLPITSTLLILNRLPKESVHNIASFLIKYNPNARGWVRGVNTCALFKKHYMLGGLTHKYVEVNLWKEVFPFYPRLHESYEKNYAAFVIIINPEMYVQKALDIIEYKYIGEESFMTTLRKFQTPIVSYSTLDSILFTFLMEDINIAKLLDIMCTLHNWPQCFIGDNHSIDSDDFWNIVGEKLEMLLIDHVLSSRNFLEKHIDDIDWYKYKRLYKCLNEEFLNNHPELYNRVQWSSFIQMVPLGEQLLGQIMDCSNKRERFHGQNINVSYIFSGQQVSETFIEEWVVGKQYDQDHVWANIFRHQTLSDEFREKYKDRLQKDSTTELRKLLNDTCKF